MKGYNTTIYKTTNYSQFKRLIGNRDLTNSRVNAIAKSIEDVGYVSNPIIVNEKMEVIDGQGRLEALKQLQMPVEYRIVPNVGVVECRSMNLTKSWTTKDYCKSYAELGNVNYQRIMDLHETYGISFAMLSRMIFRVPSARQENAKTLKDGDVVVQPELYKQMSTFADYYNSLKTGIKSVGGRTEFCLMALWWLWVYEPQTDFIRLKKCLTEYPSLVHKFVAVEDTLENFSEIFNRGLKAKNRVYWDTEYKKGLWREGSEDLSIQ